MSLPMNSRYCAYSLTISANRPIPGLLPHAASIPPDLTIEFQPSGAYPQKLLHTNSWDTRLRIGDAYAYSVLEQENAKWHHLYYFDNGHSIEFIVEPSLEHVYVFWSPHAPYHDVMSLTSGQMLGTIARLRGILCLHADVIKVEEKAIAIMGASGTGKSTTTAALNQRGCAILADDMAVLQEQAEQFIAFPTMMQLRLWKNSAESLQLEADALPRVFVRMEKRYIELDAKPDAQHRFHGEPLALRAIYLLAAREPKHAAPSIQPLSPKESLLALTKNTPYNFLLDTTQRAREFEMLARLAARVPIRVVQRPDSLDALPQVVETILRDVKNLDA